MNTDQETLNQTPPKQPFTVFLVDDDMDDLSLAARVLRSAMCVGEVVCTTNADDLFDELGARRLLDNPESEFRALILLDIHMPSQSGMTLLSQLKSSPYTIDIPVVMLTGDHHTDNIEKTYELDADSFIVKPLDEGHMEHLHTIVNKGCKRKEIF